MEKLDKIKYLYVGGYSWSRGEDLPESKPLNEKQLDVMDSYLRQIADDAFTELVNSRIDANKINDNNYNDVVSKLKSKLEQGEKVND